MAEDLVGRRLGGFELQARLGAGAFATVWRARQLRLGRDVAVKVLDPSVARNPDAARRFEREGRAAASLDHPAIVPVYEAGDEDGIVYLAMRLVDGPTLAEELAGGRLADDRLLEVLEPVASALDHAHERGVVHRDVKPSNILLEGDRVWLADFGIAASARELGRYTTGALGTASYMAPEQARAGDIDHRADLYALGCVAFEAITGHPPFERDDLVATLTAHVNDPVPVTGSPALDRFFERALAKDPDDRFQSGNAMVAALHDSLGGRPPPTGHRRGSPLRRKPVAVGLAAAVAVGVLAAALFTPSGGSDGGDRDGGPSTTAATAVAIAGGSVVVGVREVPPTVNPHRSITAEGFVAGNVLPPLFALDADLAWQPFLAAGDPEIVATEPLTARWTLRADATWDDGSPITTADVSRTFDYLRDPGAGLAATDLYMRIAALAADDDHTFTITLTEPVGDLRLLFSTFHPVIKAASLDRHLARGGTVADYLTDTVDFSGGPFRLVGFEPEQTLRLVRNDAFWGDAAPLERVEVRRLASSRASLDAIASGDVDVVFVADPAGDDVRAAGDLEGVDVTVVGGVLQYGLQLNLARPPLDEPAVREAIAWSLDRAALAAAVAAGVDDDPIPPGSLVFFPGQPGYDDRFSGYRRDIGRADELLTGAGWLPGDDGIRTRDGERLRLSLLFPDTTADVARLTALAIVLSEQLDDAGIDVVAEPVDLLGLEAAWRSGDFDLTASITPIAPDPIAAVERFASDGSINFYGYRNAEVSALLHQANALTDPVARIERFGDADALLARDLPAIPIVQLPSLLVADERLTGIVSPAHRGGPLAFASGWAFTR